MANATLERLDGNAVRIAVDLPASDYRAAADQELKRLGKSVRLKGFRPGKVPVGYLRKLYGPGVLAEAVGKRVDAAVNELIKSEDLDVFGELRPVEEPDLSGLGFDSADDLRFVFEGGLMPSVDEVDTAGLAQLHRYEVDLTDEERAQRLEGARRRFVEYGARDTVETEDDFATLRVADAELDAKLLGAAGEAHSAEPTVGNDAKDGAADADTAEHDGAAADADNDGDAAAEAEADDPRKRYFLRASEMPEEQRYKLIDKAVGTEVLLARADLREDVLQRFEDAIPEEGTTAFTVTKVDRERLPELDGELFAKVFGEDAGIADVDAAKAEFAERFRRNSQDNLDEFVLEQVIDRLAEDNPVELPRTALQHRLERARAEEIAEAAKEEREPEYAHELSEADLHGLGRRLKWMAYRRQLLERYEVELAAEDVDAGIERAYREQFANMGVDPEMFRERFFPQFKRNFMENREQVMQMTDELLNRKLVARLEDEGVLAPRKRVGEAEFQEVVNAYNQREGARIEALRQQPLAPLSGGDAEAAASDDQPADAELAEQA